MDNQEVLKQIFKNAKDGDNLGFLAAGFKAKPIQTATGGDCTHCGKIWKVLRTENELSFNFSEQTFSGGKFERVKIIQQDELFYGENYHRLNNSKKIYFKSLNKPLTESQIKIGIDDAITQIGKKYGYLSLMFGFSFLEKILPRWLKIKINIFSKYNARVCSTHCAVQDSKMGLLEFKSHMFYSPMDIINLKYYN